MKIDDKYKRYAGWLRYPVTVVILYLLLKKIELREVIEIFFSLPAGILISLLFLSIIKIFLQYTNWKIFLRMLSNNTLAKRDYLISYFVGIAFRMVSPGGVGVYGRMYFLPAKKKESFLVISYEKFIQTWSILFLGSMASALYFESIAIIYKILLPVFIFILPLLLLLLSPSKARHYQYLKRYRQTLNPAVGIQLLTGILTISQYYLFIRHFAGFSFLDAFRSVPLVQFANMLPITISGLGIREYFATEVYSQMGINAEIAVSCSLTIFALSNLLPAIMGIIMLLGKKK